MVKVESESVDPPKAVVKTVVISKGDTFPIDYKLMVGSNGKWQVYDVVIENIGLVANYRNEFSGIIRKDKFSGLMERLRAKLG
jgi:phospholipid transport system substrate-binding protein